MKRRRRAFRLCCLAASAVILLAGRPAYARYQCTLEVSLPTILVRPSG